MKKILIAFDGNRFSEGAFEFARRLNEVKPVFLAGLFFPQVSSAYLWSYTSVMAGPAFVPFMDEENGGELQKNIEHFEDLCTQHRIKYRVHKDFYDLALPELKTETRFADLLIIGGENFYENLQGADPGDHIKDALHEAECPVLVVPEHFVFPDHNILAYDGGSSSVFAIRQFAYLFPEFSNNPTMLVYSTKEDSAGVPYENYIQELAAQHFTDVSIQKLEMDANRNFSDWLKEEKNAILVSGAYGRSLLSQMFRKSFAEDVIAKSRLPVFIAHK